MSEITNESVSEITETSAISEAGDGTTAEHTDEVRETPLENGAPECAETAAATEETEALKTDEVAEAPEGTAAEQTDEAQAATGTESGETKKKKIKLPPKIQKLVDYINSHEDVRQMVFFLMFSVICGATQLIVTYALSAGLKLAPALQPRLEWFIFICDTRADFIGFLVGSIVGQVLTFVLNRKKTFNAPDYVALRATMYAFMAVLIIIMQTSLGNAVNDACQKAVSNPSGFLSLVFNLTGQLVAGIAAVIVNFLGNKFLVMRDWSKLLNKKKGETAAAAETAEAVACDVTENKED